MTPTFKIGGTEYGQYIESMSVSREDLDGKDAGRDLAGVMIRAKITSKHKIQLKCINLTQAQMQIIVTALAPEFVSITFSALDGAKTAQFYCSSVSAAVMSTMKDRPALWSGLGFNLIEK